MKSFSIVKYTVELLINDILNKGHNLHPKDTVRDTKCLFCMPTTHLKRWTAPLLKDKKLIPMHSLFGGFTILHDCNSVIAITYSVARARALKFHIQEHMPIRACNHNTACVWYAAVGIVVHDTWNNGNLHV